MDLIDFIVRNGFKPGDKLPPERDLVAEFGMSVISLRRGMNELATQGLIETVQGLGSFLRVPIGSVASQGTVALIDIQKSRPYATSPLATDLQMKLDERGLDFSLLPAVRPSANLSRALDGVVGVMATGWIDEEWARFLELLPYPLVVIGSNPFPERFHTVTYDYKRAGEMLVERFVERGLTRIGVVNGAHEYMPAQMIHAGWMQALERRGVTIDESATIWPAVGETYQSLGNFLKAGRFDAIIVESGATIHVLSWCWNHSPAIAPVMGLIADALPSFAMVDPGPRICLAKFSDSVSAGAVELFHRILSKCDRRLSMAIAPQLCGV